MIEQDIKKSRTASIKLCLVANRNDSVRTPFLDRRCEIRYRIRSFLCFSIRFCYCLSSRERCQKALDVWETWTNPMNELSMCWMAQRTQSFYYFFDFGKHSKWRKKFIIRILFLSMIDQSEIFQTLQQSI